MTSLSWRAVSARRRATETAERACHPVAPCVHECTQTRESRRFLNQKMWGRPRKCTSQWAEGSPLDKPTSKVWFGGELTCLETILDTSRISHKHHLRFKPECRWGKRQKVNHSGWCLVTGLALKGHRWEPATLISLSLATLHNYHIETLQPFLLFQMISHIWAYFWLQCAAILSPPSSELQRGWLSAEVNRRLTGQNSLLVSMSSRW